MPEFSNPPRVLFVTPEVINLPPAMDHLSGYVNVRAGGVADFSATLIQALFEQGVDIHVALPNYRKIFQQKLPSIIRREFDDVRNRLPEGRIHLAEDRGFFYLNQVSYGTGTDNIKIALNFQREVINNIIPRVQPDLIHSNDWMTGLIPAMTRKTGIPSLFTIHNTYSADCPLSCIEDAGIDAAFFWQNLIYKSYPTSYEKTRDANPVDLLTSGVFAAHFVNTVSPTFLTEIIEGRHDRAYNHLQEELANKRDAECVVGILNAPDPSYNPLTDKALYRRFSAKDHHAAKQYNKLFLQEKLGLLMDSRAPVFFWPSRLDPDQKGCGLLTEILDEVVHIYGHRNLEIVFVADGEFKPRLKEIVKFLHLENRVAICDFDERLARLAYGASDFLLMPSRFEPCGLPQMIGPLYGALPVVHDTGGLHDTIIHMDVDKGIGNGFVFKNHDRNGLFWAIKEAIRFYDFPRHLKCRQIERVMLQSAAIFNPSVMAAQYMELYEKMLERPLFAI